MSSVAVECRMSRILGYVRIVYLGRKSAVLYDELRTVNKDGISHCHAHLSYNTDTPIDVSRI